MLSSFLSALDQTALGTALPTIAAALGEMTAGSMYGCVGSAYAMSSSAFIPLSGGLANAFGRKPVMLLCIAFFALGSALAGASVSMIMLIVARAIQGVGGGGILALTQILIADLVPLSQRGLYQGVVSFVWAVASSIGPPIGGVLSSTGNWRWLFYLNLPLTALAFLLVLSFLPVRKPEGSIRDKLGQVDRIGNILVITGTTLSLLGITWGGTRYRWLSVQVLVPLILGLSILVAFLVYEVTICGRRCTYPTIPRDVVGNRTSVSGLLATAAHSIASISVVYYIPVLFQSVFLASPLRSAVDYLPGSLLGAPAAFLAGFIINASKKYRPVNWAGWVTSIIAFGLFSTIREDSPTALWVSYQVVGAIGLGMLAILGADIPDYGAVTKNADCGCVGAVLVHEGVLPGDFLHFSATKDRSRILETWGITISSVILQSSLRHTLPPAILATLPPGFEYAAITTLRDLDLDATTRKEVQRAFAESMARVWLAMGGVCVIGLVISLGMREVEMRREIDERYGLAVGEKLEGGNKEVDGGKA
ncbi:MFS general substrate transporter [Mycena kentingensis (nom. inval.)]|nr:MFS general substrate transporter [Mycena kentingensis (nom. inval.)]